MPSLPENPSIREVANALVVPIPSHIDTPQPPETGVLTADLAPVAESITWRGDNRWTFEPRIPKSAEISDLSGRHMFAGLMYGHFGHFLVESTARLWALDRLDGSIDSVIFVPKVQRGLDRVLAKYSAFLDLLDISAPFQTLATPTRVENLFVPEQGFGMFNMVGGTEVYRRFMRSRLARRIVADGPRKIYISRSALSQQRGGLFAEKWLEGLLEAEGYTVYHPQNHGFEHQLATYKAADFIISPDGSPLHMAALVVRPETRIGVVARRPNVALQFLLQFRAFCGITPAIVNVLARHWMPEAETTPNRLSYGELDFPRLHEHLKLHGLIGDGPTWSELSGPEWENAMSDLENRQKTRFKLFAEPG